MKKIIVVLVFIVDIPEAILGTTEDAASTLGRLGGSAKSDRKAAASRENGKKGGSKKEGAK